MAKSRDWYRLDNAAKLIPSTTSGSDTRVFRICCELKEDVDPEVLQHALDQTMEEFPHYLCCLRKGMFWYYLDSVNEKPMVKEEKKPALSAIYIPGRKNLLFQINYFKRRVNLDMFHVLSDGTGAYIFLSTIIQYYLIEKYQLDETIMQINTSSVEEKTDDAFNHFYQKKNTRSRNWLKEMFPRRSVRLKGIKDANLQNHLLEGTVSVKDLLAVAHEKNVTIGELATGVFIEAIIQDLPIRKRKYPVVVSVPVNLRQFFPSLTTRNFFGVIPVVFETSHYDGTLESILVDVQKEFKENLSPDAIEKTMNSYAALEHNWAIKMVPLFAKDLGLHWIKRFMDTGISTSVSNVGKVDMPESMTPYIERFSCFMSTKSTQMCISTFADNLTFGITTRYTIHDVPYRFFRRLVELGLEVELATNDYDQKKTKNS